MYRKRKSISAPKVALFFIATIAVLFYLQSKDKGSPIKPEVVWEYLEPLANSYKFEPGFIFSIAMAESFLNAHAEDQNRRGIMLISQEAWEETTDRPFDDAWDWQLNLQIGVRYLDTLRAKLRKNNHDNTPTLAAAYRFGLDAVKDVNYKLDYLPDPNNPIYRRLLAGEASPLTVEE